MKKILKIFKQKNILTLSYLFCRELKRGNGFPFFKGRIRALPRDEKDSPDFRQKKNILTPSYLPFRELKRGNVFPFSKGESALPGDEKDSTDFQAEKVF